MCQITKPDASNGLIGNEIYPPPNRITLEKVIHRHKKALWITLKSMPNKKPRRDFFGGALSFRRPESFHLEMAHRDPIVLERYSLPDPIAAECVGKRG